MECTPIVSTFGRLRCDRPASRADRAAAGLWRRHLVHHSTVGASRDAFRIVRAPFVSVATLGNEVVRLTGRSAVRPAIPVGARGVSLSVSGSSLVGDRVLSSLDSLCRCSGHPCHCSGRTAALLRAQDQRGGVTLPLWIVNCWLSVLSCPVLSCPVLSSSVLFQR